MQMMRFLFVWLVNMVMYLFVNGYIHWEIMNIHIDFQLALTAACEYHHLLITQWLFTLDTVESFLEHN
jgi:hypothetical protein